MISADKQRILILGATGMLGHAVFRLLAAAPAFEVHATARSTAGLRLLPEHLHSRTLCGVDVENPDALVEVFGRSRPDVVINCVGLVKQLAGADDPLAALPINAILPHRLSRLCRLVSARLIHVSTDCVFNGSKGGYRESDLPDATDLYGRSKLLGEVVDESHAITLRTSIIGHELAGARSLIGWFLAQREPVQGYRRAVFSGLPTVELARVIRDHVLPRPELHGLYHVSSDAIDKFRLLTLVAAAYGQDTAINENSEFVIDRSLDSTRFRLAAGYQPLPWETLVERMHQFH